MGESTKAESAKKRKNRKRKAQKKPENKEVNEEEAEQQQSPTKLRKPSAPVQKSHKKVKKEQRNEQEKEKTLGKYKSSAVAYLETWQNDKANWKFSKNVQNWIASHLYDSKLLPDSLWSMVLEYFAGSKGIVKANIVESATKIIEGAEKSDEENEVDDIKMSRARDIIQSIDN